MKRAAARLDGLRTPEGEPLPPNLRLVVSSTWSVDGSSVIISGKSRRALERINNSRVMDPRIVRLSARVMGVGREIADSWCRRCCCACESTRRRALCGPHWLAGREREERRGKGWRDPGIRVRREMIQLAWRFLLFQKDSTLASGSIPPERPRHSQDYDRGLGARPISTDRWEPSLQHRRVSA